MHVPAKKYIKNPNKENSQDTLNYFYNRLFKYCIYTEIFFIMEDSKDIQGKYGNFRLSCFTVTLEEW